MGAPMNNKNACKTGCTYVPAGTKPGSQIANSKGMGGKTFFIGKIDSLPSSTSTTSRFFGRAEKSEFRFKK